MATAALLELVAGLTPNEQEAVRAFVEYLRRPSEAPGSVPQSGSLFAAAAEEFMREHPELLRRLSQ